LRRSWKHGETPMAQHDIVSSADIERRQLEYFIAVADYGGYTRAAERLFVTQSTLSRGINNLERALDGRLFERVDGSLALTTLGDAVIGPARRVLYGFIEVKSSAATMRNLSRAHLVIASISTLSADPTATVIGHLKTKYPGITA